MIDAIDLSKPEGGRNKAILEVLYGCGLRVSELTELRLSNLYLDIEFIKVTGKGSKERLVPIGGSAINALKIWIEKHSRAYSDKKGRGGPGFFKPARHKADAGLYLFNDQGTGCANQYHQNRQSAYLSGTPLPPIWLKATPICGPCRKCWDMRVLPRRKFIRIWIGSI